MVFVYFMVNKDPPDPASSTAEQSEGAGKSLLAYRGVRSQRQRLVPLRLEKVPRVCSAWVRLASRHAAGWGPCFSNMGPVFLFAVHQGLLRCTESPGRKVAVTGASLRGD